MPKSRNNKSHNSRVLAYKANTKKSQEILKKKMLDEYIKHQQSMMSENAHTSTEEANSPNIDIDSLNDIDQEVEFNIDEQILDDIEVEPTIDVDSAIEVETTQI